MRMQFQVWIAGLAMGVDLKTRAKRIRKKRAAKVASTPTRKSKLQQVA